MKIVWEALVTQINVCCIYVSAAGRASRENDGKDENKQ